MRCRENSTVKSSANKPLARATYRGKDNIKMDLKEHGATGLK
jgi:hypothetical protein